MIARAPLRLPAQNGSRRHSDRLVPHVNEFLKFPASLTVIPLRAMNVQLISHAEFCRCLAMHLSNWWLGNEWHVQEKLTALLGISFDWVHQLATSVVATSGSLAYAPRNALQTWLGKQPVLKRLFKKRKKRLPEEVLRRLRRYPASMLEWVVPQVSNAEELCRMLDLDSIGCLDWLLLPHQQRGFEESPRAHYRRSCVKKRAGGERWIEEPRPKLKAAQRRIHTAILQHVPMHPAAHAYQRGLSVKTCAAEHVGKRLVLKLDLVNFFGSITITRVRALFRNLGFTPDIAWKLAQLCTAPALLDDLTEGASLLRRTRLPQGAPSSPALANAIAYRLDRRLAGLARAVRAKYTRYADDLIFSGGDRFAAGVDRFATSAAAIAMEEGFSVAFRKTRKMPSGGEQRVLGLTVNEKLNLNRRDVENLKAELTNCVRHGWRTQNQMQLSDYASHLRGRIAHLHSINPNRGGKLLEIFERIDWS